MSRARAKHLGLLAPSHAPKFQLVRKPLWVKNQTLPAASLERLDPVEDASASQDPIYHYQTHGNNFVRHPWHEDMKWDDFDDYIAFKCYIKPYAISGRRLIFSQKNGPLSGGFFVDMLDGKVRMGWYDSVQKREVWIGTDVPVLRLGRWHVIEVRKRHPRTTAGSGCWQDSIFQRTAATARDRLLVRELSLRNVAPITVAPNGAWWPTNPTWTSKLARITFPWGIGVARDSVSFTTDLEYSIAGCSATGLVSRNDVTYTGAVAGRITASARMTDGFTTPPTFGDGMHQNMLWQWSTANGGPEDGKLFVVTSCSFNGLVIDVIDPVTGLAPDLSGYAAGSTGGIFSGVRLVKSTGFSSATNPDNSSRDFELFGSHLSGNPETGIAPFVGEFASWAFVVANGAASANPNLFEAGAGVADDSLIGTDGYEEFLLTNPWGELHTDPGNVHSAVDTQDYAGDVSTSSRPNEKRIIEQDQHASAFSTDPRWGNVGRNSPAKGRYEAAVAFYDPEQADILPYSAPGPTRVIRLPGEDKSNPSSFVGLRFYNLPVSRDKGDIQRWLFLSELNNSVKFLAAVVPDNISTDVVVTGPDEFRPRGTVLDTDNEVPPRCRFVESTQGVLAFGGADGQPDLIVWSKPFFPAAVPRGRNVFQVPSGASEGLTGMVDFNGRVLAFKRDSVYRAVLRDGAVVYDKLTPDMGCVSHGSILTLQNQLYWVGEQGLCVYTGGGIPEWISARLETFFNDGLDQQAADRITAAVNRRRNQIVLAVRELGELYQSHRVTAELARVDVNPSHRFGRHDDPGLVCVASLRDRGGQTSRLIGGTDDGFAVWLDRADTALVMLGPTAAVWGDSALVASTGSTATRVTLQGTPNMDLEQAGPRGAKLRWGTFEALVLFAEANALHLDRVLASSAIPADGTALTLGVRTRYWRTKWLDLGVAETRKRYRHLDVVHTKEASGSVLVTAYEDFGTTAESVGTIPLTGPGWCRIAIDKIQTRFVQFAFESSSPFEITEIVLRASDADPR